jgi:N-acetyl-anhydromuramyl-L-alanine amidase AmpD
LEKLAEFIAKNYPNVQKDNIIGHNEAAKAASRETICPGANFEKVWKKKLIRLIY